MPVLTWTVVQLAAHLALGCLRQLRGGTTILYSQSLKEDLNICLLFQFQTGACQFYDLKPDHQHEISLRHINSPILDGEA
jgi:hypothetical protein